MSSNSRKSIDNATMRDRINCIYHYCCLYVWQCQVQSISVILQGDQLNIAVCLLCLVISEITEEPENLTQYSGWVSKKRHAQSVQLKIFENRPALIGFYKPIFNDFSFSEKYDHVSRRTIQDEIYYPGKLKNPSFEFVIPFFRC